MDLHIGILLKLLLEQNNFTLTKDKPLLIKGFFISYHRVKNKNLLLNRRELKLKDEVNLVVCLKQ